MGSKRPPLPKRAVSDSAGLAPRGTRMEQGFDEARVQGVGINPGAGTVKQVQWGNPFKQIGGAIKAIVNYNPYKKK